MLKKNNKLTYMSRQLIFESEESLIYTETTNSGKQIIKVMRSEFPTADQTLRFNNEYEYTVNLTIPGIRKAIAKKKEEDHNVLVLEYIEGVTLEEAFQKTSFDRLGAVLDLFIKIAFSLGKLHEKGIIHKDINGSNILWDTIKEAPVIIDFGISCQLDLISSNVGNPEKVKGTLSHMSPEQTGRLNRQIDNRSDLYALGVTMFILLTGEHPFKSKDPLELVHMHIAIPAPAVHDINPEMPEMLSVIIGKLMAKNADDRYQTAFGLVHDLKLCLEQYNSKRKIDVFETGLEDFSGHFRIPQKLYGRYDELKTIYKSFERVCKGNSEFLLVSGYSGIGKSALIMELYKPITEYKGFFAKGKFDQYQRNIPYFAIMQAFNEFCNLLLTENSDKLSKWKNNILEALGGSGSIMTAFIPALEKIIGKQPEVSRLEAQESQNRFRLVLHKFLNAVTKPEHPLVLFIDDLQWADAASLGLIQSLICDTTNHYLMIIGAYRDNEVTAAHPLMNMVNLALKDGAHLNTVELKPLREEHIFQLIKDSLLASDAIVQELTEIIYSKTQGNAFFTIEFLRSLQQYGLIKYNFDKKRWDVNFEAIHKRGISNNVVDLLVSKISFLPGETCNALKFASCIGAVFSMQTLSFILGTDVKSTLKVLWEAIRLGMLRPVGDSYQYVGFSEEDTMPEVEIEFAHDRIQQAFYSLMSDEKHKEVHLQIARLLFRHTEDNNLFGMVNHFNEALTLINDEQERRDVCELNFRAGVQARNSSAYQPALARKGCGKRIILLHCCCSKLSRTLST
jgi:histidine kinase